MCENWDQFDSHSGHIHIITQKMIDEYSQDEYSQDQYNGHGSSCGINKNMIKKIEKNKTTR